ncbi:hypothetical protein VSP10_07460 [Myroides odoratimimus]|uniref:hypothetical protein n=1 Tax=Myroides odoratimimus TaxID=76832 RepID=UPI002DBCDCF0|nr:hypothetical protein [Myroides odoratimimus]MEC4052625.1 hypothetical protein [Myroides odoratimimus]
MYRLEIQKLLLAIDENLDDQELCLSFIRQGIQIADKHSDLDWGVELRYSLIHEERATSGCTESVLAFAWILDVCDRYPERFHESEFLLEYEWMLCSAYSNASLSTEQILAVADDLYARLERNHISKRGYYFTMAEYVQNIGDYAKGEEYIKLAMQEPYDDENIEIMEYDYRIENLVLMGRFDEAIVLMEQVELKKLSDFALPFETYCAMAYCMAKVEDVRASIYLEKAKASFETLREVNSSMLYSMTRLMYAMYLLKDSVMWSTFERIADWEIDAEDDLQFMLSRHAALICAQGGVIALDLSPRLSYYEPNGKYDLTQLYEYYDNIATRLGLQFDSRNGSDFCSKEYKELKMMNGIKV